MKKFIMEEKPPTPSLMSVSESTSMHVLPNREASKMISYATFLQRKWTHFSRKHYCALIPSLRKTEIRNEIIDSGLFIDLRRRFRKFLMISEKHPYTPRVFKSKTAFRNEEMKHLIKYYWMVHPFSLAALYFNFFMTIVYLYSLIYIIPTNWIHIKYYHSIKWHTFTVDMIITASTMANFFIGYFDPDIMYVEMNRRKVAKRHLKTYFFLDLLSCITSYLIYFFLTAAGPTYLNLCKFTMVCRLVRFKTMDATLNVFSLYFGFSTAFSISLEIFMKTYMTILFSLGISAFLQQYPYLVEHISNKKDASMALDIFFNTVAEMFGVGRVPNFAKYGETIEFVLFPIFAMLLHFWIISKIYTLWQRTLMSSQIGEDHKQQIGSYLEYKGLPSKIREEIYVYLDFTYQKKFFNESSILNIMSENLRKEIPNYKLRRTVEKIKFLKPLPNHLLMTLIAHMDITYYCPGDIIFRAGTISKTFYYIKYGTVALFDERDVEICHLEDNSYYGDISVVLNGQHQETMLALSPCEICRLRQHVLMDILENFPELKARVFDVCREQLPNRKQDWVASSFKLKPSVSILLDDKIQNNFA